MIHKMSTEQKPQIPHIVFESGDFENDIEMLLIEKEGEFYIHLHNSFTDDSMVMKVEILTILIECLFRYQIIFNENK